MPSLMKSGRARAPRRNTTPREGSVSTRLRTTLAAAGASSVLLAAPAPAPATVVDQGRFVDEPDGFSYGAGQSTRDGLGRELALLQLSVIRARRRTGRTGVGRR